MDPAYERLCNEVFETVRSSPRTRLSLTHRWLGPNDEDWVSSYDLETGGRSLHSPPVRNWLLLKTEQQMSNWADPIAHRLFSSLLSCENRAAWRNRHEFLRDHLLRQFFRASSHQPALVWATPLWFLNSAAIPKAKLTDMPGKLTNLRPQDNLVLGNEKQSLSFPRRLVRFHYDRTQEQDNEADCRLVKNSNRRREIRIPGQPPLLITEDVLSLACRGGPVDEPVLQAGKIPVHRSSYAKGPTGPYLRESVITLATMKPIGDPPRHASVDHVTIFFSHDDARVREVCRTTGWDFSGFIAFHPGLAAVLQMTVRPHQEGL